MKKSKKSQNEDDWNNNASDWQKTCYLIIKEIIFTYNSQYIKFFYGRKI